MISFTAGDWRFHFRAAAVVRHGRLVLLHRLAEEDFWSLPGGRVEMGETAEDAVRREMREELDVDVRVTALRAVVENRFVYGGQLQHGLELHFDVALPEGSPLIGCEPFERVEESGEGLDGGAAKTTRLVFQWFDVSALPSVDLRPAFLKQTLAIPDAAVVQHIVHDDRA